MGRASSTPRRVFDYYVDSAGGDDANDGLTTTTAWETSTKVNASTFAPHDRIWFKRGGTYGPLVPPSAGEEGKYILFAAYGTGARPIIDGSTGSALLVDIDNGVHYLRFDSLDFAGSSAAGQHTARYYSDNGYFYDCIFRGALGNPYGTGFTAFTETGAEIYNITLDTCQFYDNYASGIIVGSNTGAGGPHDCLIKNCIAHDNGHSTSADHGIYVRHGVTIDRCTSYANSCAGFKVNCEAVLDSPYTPILKNSVAYGNPYGIIVDNIGSIIYNNLIYGCSYTGLQIGLASDDCLIYFNTFANCTAGNALIEVNGNPAGAILKNNLFIQDAAVYDKGLLATVEPLTIESVVGANTFDYNAYFHNASADGHGFWDGSGNHVFSVWQGLGADAHSTSLGALPGLVTRYTDFHPVDGGNLKGLGLAIAGYELDKDGETRADPPTPGCYETAG